MSAPAVWEIINPSDPYTMEADDFEVATVACYTLGGGRMGLREIGGAARTVPVMLFGWDRAWFAEHFGCDELVLVQRVRSTKADALASAFESCMIGRASDRASYRKGLELIDDPEKRLAWRDHWHDERRSSLNDIGRVAWEMAASIRKGMAAVASAPATQDGAP